MINIVKYGNRKLYAKNFSKYITLLDLVNLVKANNKVQILNNTTKEDITTVEFKRALMHVEMSEEQLRNLIKNN